MRALFQVEGLWGFVKGIKLGLDCEKAEIAAEMLLQSLGGGTEVASIGYRQGGFPYVEKTPGYTPPQPPNT